MTRTEFKEWLIKASEEFDKSINTFTDMPEELPLDEWLDQFSFFYNTVMEE